MATQFATINGHRLRYRLAGEGPLAVFGHGLLGSIEQLDAHHGGIARLEEHVRLLVYDARGHGHSDGPDHPDGYTWESLALDMAALVEHAGEREAIIGGGSMSAAAALWLAIERPEYVRALLLVMPPPLGFESMRGPDEQQAIQVLDLLRSAVETVGLEKTIEMAKQFPGFAPTPEEAEERARWLLSVNPKALLHAIRGLLASPIHDPETYRQIAVPTLVVAHEGDPLHPVRAAKLVAEKVPGSRLIVGPEPYYWRYHPDELNAEVTSFLAALG